MNTKESSTRRGFLGSLGAFLACGSLASNTSTQSRSAHSKATPFDSKPIPAWPEEPDQLAAWRQAKRELVVKPTRLIDYRVANASRSGTRLRVRYFGGSQPGEAREITPGSLFKVDGFGPTYLQAYCHKRQAIRTFAVERMEVVG